jgi:hypothetical protein
MPAKVFISCGQASPAERQVTNSISAWFSSQGFSPYVAIQVQSILDLNAGIIGDLKTSDYYLFVNLRRERLKCLPRREYRGSLFTNQELAIAYALGFEHMLMINQLGVRREGVFQFMVSNVPEFTMLNEVLGRVQSAVQTAGWHPDYTRQLDVAGHYFTLPFIYGDHAGSRHVCALHLRVKNGRPDIGAVGTIARLFNMTNPSGNQLASPDRTQLKASGHPAYSQTIWPNSEGTFDLLAIDMNNQSHAYLHSELDVHPRTPIITQPGMWLLDYEIFSQGFPRLSIRVELHLTGNHATTTATVTKL